eukprot:scaffold3795_cov126-Isochrysis_galbana.AAC.8
MSYLDATEWNTLPTSRSLSCSGTVRKPNSVARVAARLEASSLDEEAEHSRRLERNAAASRHENTERIDVFARAGSFVLRRTRQKPRGPGLPRGRSASARAFRESASG